MFWNLLMGFELWFALATSPCWIVGIMITFFDRD